MIKKIRMIKWGLTFLLSMMVILLAASAGYSQAIITNGSGLYLGVNPLGDLNAPGDSQGGPLPTYPGDDTGAIGLYVLGVGDATAPGCLCEGWGVSVNGTSAGWADEAYGSSNLEVDSFTSGTSTATSLVHLSDTPGISVSQAYSLSASSSLFKDVVTITNTTGATVNNVRYNRTMDWDIPPTPFYDLVTIQGWPATNLIHSSDNGFKIPNPLDLSGSICGGPADDNANFTDSGVCDHGADFVFDFGSLANGASKSFIIYYGASTTEVGALAALGTVGAEVYSLGQYAGDPTGLGTPDSRTFIFGFGGVGGTPVATPEPTSLILLGSGLLGLVALKRKKAQVQ